MKEEEEEKRDKSQYSVPRPELEPLWSELVKS
jgi:hypothetical protein